MGRMIDADALLKRVEREEIQAQIHGREFSTCFMSPGNTASTEWWFVEDLIENAPTIEERKTGKWERHYSRQNVYADLYWHCSECGYRNDNQYANVYHKFCSNCGARMEVKE